MKINKREELIKNISKSLAESQHILNNFESHNLEHCSKLAHLVVKLYEARNISLIFIHDKRNYEKLVEYFNSVYSSHVCLVLRRGRSEYSYTRNNIMKSLRGAWAHTSRDINANKKQEVFDEFMYETSNIEALFCISKSFVYFPCSILYEGTNSDSVRVICETLKRADGQEVELTLVESILMSICSEVSNLLKYGELKWRKTILFLEGIDGYISDNDIKQRILCQSKDWKLFCNR